MVLAGSAMQTAAKRAAVKINACFMGFLL